jgi:hypothetical protein
MTNRPQIIELGFSEEIMNVYSLWVGDDISPEELEALKEAISELGTADEVGAWLEENTEEGTIFTLNDPKIKPLGDMNTEFARYKYGESFFEKEQPSNEDRLNELRSQLKAQLKNGVWIQGERIDEENEHNFPMIYSDHENSLATYEFVLGYSVERESFHIFNRDNESTRWVPFNEVPVETIISYLEIQNAK